MAKKNNKKTKVDPKSNSELFNDIYGQIEDSVSDTGTWATKRDDYQKLRMRIKKTKTFPFPGCANLRMPTIEIIIRKIKSALVGLYSNIKPRTQVVPQSDDDLQKAYKIERFLDWVVDVQANVLQKLIILTDKVLEKGFCLLKVTWKMEDTTRTETVSLDELKVEEALALTDPNVPPEEIFKAMIERLGVDMSETVQQDNTDALIKAIEAFRSGEKEVKITLRDELYNAPFVEVVDPEYCYVPADAPADVQKLRFIAHEYYESFEDIKQKSDRGIFDAEEIDTIDYLKGLTNERNTEVTKDYREGIERANNPSHLVKLLDIYMYYDLDNDGVEEKCQFILAPEFKVVLKKQRLPFDHQKFPFIRFNYELIDDRWFSSRGIPELLEDIAKEIDTQHNQKIDNQTIRNAPIFTFRTGVVNPRLVRFIPGQAIPVNGMTPLNDALQILNNNNPNVEFSYEREQMILETKVQEFVGQIDYSLQSMINRRQPRTLGEVQMQTASANQVFSLDAAMFTASLSEMFMQILQLCQQYMPERIFTLVVGENGTEPLHMTRDEIQGKYHLVCRGNDQNTNPMIKMQKAQGRVQLLLGNPIALQTGVVTPMNIFNIYKRYLQDDGELMWQELISQPQPPQMPPPPPPDVKIPYEELTPAERSQVLAKQGINPDLHGQMLNKMEMLNDKHTENIKDIGGTDFGGGAAFGGDTGSAPAIGG